jgi:hypothetical protein
MLELLRVEIKVGMQETRVKRKKKTMRIRIISSTEKHLIEDKVSFIIKLTSQQ